MISQSTKFAQAHIVTLFIKWKCIYMEILDSRMVFLKLNSDWW